MLKLKCLHEHEWNDKTCLAVRETQWYMTNSSSNPILGIIHLVLFSSVVQKPGSYPRIVYFLMWTLMKMLSRNMWLTSWTGIFDTQVRLLVCFLKSLPFLLPHLSIQKYIPRLRGTRMYEQHLLTKAIVRKETEIRWTVFAVHFSEQMQLSLVELLLAKCIKQTHILQAYVIAVWHFSALRCGNNHCKYFPCS